MKYPFTIACLFGSLCLQLHALKAQLTSVDTKLLEAVWEVSDGTKTEGNSYAAKDTSGAGSVKLSKPDSRSAIISGKLVLPELGGIRMQFGEGGQPVKEGEAPDPSQAPPKPIAFIRKPAEKQNLFVAITEGKPSEPLPFKVILQDDSVAVYVGASEKSVLRTKAPFALTITLNGGAVLSDLQMQEIPPTNDVPVAGLAEIANAVVAGKDASVGKLAVGALPTGFVKSEGVTFYLSSEKALDVAPSMSGIQEPFRNKHNFYRNIAFNLHGREVLAVQGDQYEALHILAFSAGRPDHAQRMTVRIGYYGDGSAILEDEVIKVPALIGGQATPEVVGQVPVTLADGKKGTVWHIRVPFAKTGNIKEFGKLDLEFTRDMNVHVMPPDPNEFGKIPAGPPSDVVVLAATLSASPVTMTYVTDEPGNVFHDTQKPEFKLALTNRSSLPQEVKAIARCAGPGTPEDFGVERREWTVEQSVKLPPGESRDVVLDVTPGKRGWFSCRLDVESNGRLVQRRDTTFAVLAPDTRKAGFDSPFGIWEFWRAHSIRPLPDQIDRLASLINKGGWRHTYGGAPSMERIGSAEPEVYDRLKEKYKINFTIPVLPHSYQRDGGWYDEAEFNKIMPDAIANYRKKTDGAFKVLHESRSSGELVRRYSEYLGGRPYTFPDEESAKLNEQFENVKKYTAGIKKISPESKIVLINDYPVVANEYLKRGFPKENFDAIGLEGAMFLRQPERQPDWLSVLGNFQEMRRAQEKYGYDKPVWTTEALYHATEAGALTLHDQATIAVREAMIVLQLGVERMAAAGGTKDSSDDYYSSNWGSCGYCFRDPEINPKPAYAAYAWLTQVLDQAKPAGKVATPNRSLYLVDFVKPDGSRVYSLWTTNGLQKVTLDFKNNAEPKLFDFYGNPMNVKQPLVLEASTTPLYITDAEIAKIASAEPVEEPEDKSGETLLEFDLAGSLKPLDKENEVLNSVWQTPMIRGLFDVENVEVDGQTALKVSLKADEDNRKLLPRYVELALDKPIELKGRPYEFLARVKGNSGWGNIIFEMVDAKGRVWTSIGNQYSSATNSNDPRDLSAVNFEGWKTIRVPIVGMYPGKDQSLVWPDHYTWWAWPSPEGMAAPEIAARKRKEHAEAKLQHEAAVKAAEAEYAEAKTKYDAAINDPNRKGARPPKPVKKKVPDAPRLGKVDYQGAVPVDYPLKLTKIIVSMRPHILYLDEEVHVENPAVYIDKLSVAQPPEGF